MLLLAYELAQSSIHNNYNKKMVFPNNSRKLLVSDFHNMTVVYRAESLFYDYINVLGLSYISRVPGSFAGTFGDL